MKEVGIRELKQNASAVVARAVEGETVTITDRGRPVALLTGIEKSPLERLQEAGHVTVPSNDQPIWKVDIEPTPLSAGLTGQMILDELREERL